MHFFAAASMWTLAGLGLSTAGLLWLLRASSHWTWLGMLLALAIGGAKGMAILRRTAARNVARIDARGDDRCLGGFLSLRGWLLVAGMMILGRILRASPIPRTILGAVYLAIGIALLLGSFELWRAWWGSRVRK
jgi:hypothetical protein